MRVLILVLLLALPAAGQVPPPGAPGPVGPSMPDVRGLSLEAATRAMRGAGLADFEVAEVQVATGQGTVVRQSPLPGAVVEARGYRPRLSVGVPREPARPRPQAAPPPPPRPPVRWWAWGLVLLGTAGMAWLGREAVRRWHPPPPPEAPSIEVTKVTRPERRKRR